MAEISATIGLRPTRIGFLVRPNDINSITKIMQICSCIWGGFYNPIIPVFRVSPKDWRGKYVDKVKGLNVAKGYIRFFEPDVYVESEEGLLEEVGLSALRKTHSMEPLIVSLDEFLKPREHREWSEPFFGLNIVDVFKNLYETEHRFQLKTPRDAVYVIDDVDTALVDAIFGSFPKQSHAAYFSKGYVDVFSPKELKPTPDTWLEVYANGAQTPLRATKHKLVTQRSWHHDEVIYVFDPDRPTDLIDLWNLRLEPRPILPVPLKWFQQLSEFLRQVILDTYRPVVGNPHGVMHHATIEFARSINKELREHIVQSLSDLPTGSFVIKNCRNSIWHEHVEERVHKDRRMSIVSEEQRTTIEIKSGELLSSTFKTLSPAFASEFGGHDNRWVNTLTLRKFGCDDIATVIPFNLFDRNWPRFGISTDGASIGSEGWTFGQRFKNSTEYLKFLTMEDAIIGSLGVLGVNAKLSDPGHIAKQMLDSVGGIRGVHLFANLETLQLLNNMAGSLRRRANENETIEETFEGRSSPIKNWVDHISKRKALRPIPEVSLANFTNQNIIKLGLETNCPHCQVANWHSLTAVDYEVICERCLKKYDFPQAGFVAWRRSERSGYQENPQLIIGEAKSFGQGNLIKADDLAKLKAIGRKLPGTFIVISVLRKHFTDYEKKLLKSFVNWSRRIDVHGRPTNPVILLTANELFFEFLMSATWEKLGDIYKPFANYEHTHNLYNFAEATQRIYLGIDSHYEWKASKWKKRKVL